jgi:hypothetical protein
MKDEMQEQSAKFSDLCVLGGLCVSESVQSG